MKTSSRRSTATKVGKKPAPPKKKTSPVRTANLDKAIKDYEEALRLFSKGDYSRAAHHFEAVIRDYPTEREVGDRARMHIAVCRSRTSTSTPKPKTEEDLYLHGVFAANQGRLDESADLLDRLIKQDPASDKAYYALAAVCSQRGDRAGAISNLMKAIELNSNNRIQALNNPDFDSLREDAGFMALLGKTAEGFA